MDDTTPQTGRLDSLSIVDFMTDGALPALCETLSRLGGVTIRLRDSSGILILPAKGTPPWKLVPERLDPRSTIIPLTASDTQLGLIEISHTDSPEREMRDLTDTVSMLASAVTEICEGQVELRHNVGEITVLYKLSSMLAGADNVESILRIGLESTLDVLALNAGAIVLFPEKEDGRLSADEKDLRFAASMNLSEAWLSSPVPLSTNREFDRLALSGEILTVDDLRTDPRIQIADAVKREGLVSTIHAGMLFRDHPIGILRAYSRAPRAFAPSEQRLIRSIAQHLAVAVQQARLLDVQREERRIQRQLKFAASVQRRMLPTDHPRVAPFDVAATWTPSVELSGDFYDFTLGMGQVGMVVGDVVGKGVGAALLMSAVRASLRAHADEGHAVNEVINRVNRDLCRDTRPEEFATVWFAKADPASLELSYASAGHDLPILARTQEGAEPKVLDIPGGGLIAGVDPDQTYDAHTLQLEPGDVLVMFTDGVTDALDFDGSRFGRQRLRESIAESLREHPEGSAAEVLDRIFRNLRSFTGLTPRTDDRTVIVLRVETP